jgi:hypothetical protein
MAVSTASLSAGVKLQNRLPRLEFSPAVAESRTLACTLQLVRRVTISRRAARKAVSLVPPFGEQPVREIWPRFSELRC